jgi:hypothetical protein
VLKSTSAQVRKFFFAAPQRKLRFSKAQVHSLRFTGKLLDATFNRNFYKWIWYGKISLHWLLKHGVKVQRLEM